MAHINQPYQYTPLGYMQLSAGTAVVSMTAGTTYAPNAGTGAPTRATLASVHVGGTAVRYRDDGGTPTASVGQVLDADTTYNLWLTRDGFREFRAISAAGTAGTATIDINFYG